MTVVARQVETGSPVRVQVVGSQIQIQAPELFHESEREMICELIVRVFQSADVLAISIDRANSKINIEYDRAGLTPPLALREISQLIASDAETSTHPLIRECLDRIPGPVKKISRHVVATTKGVTTGSEPTHSLFAENLIVEYDVEPDGASSPIWKVEGPETVLPKGTLPADLSKPWTGEIVVGGVRRFVNLTAAGGCMLMSVVGIVTPGIPTVPFVLATGYFLAHSSPKLHARFRRSKLFGKMVSDYEDYGGVTQASKHRAMLFSAGLILLTLVIAQPSPPLLILIATMGGMSLYLINRLPTLPTEPAAASA